MNIVHQKLNVIHRGFRDDAVAQIEDMPRPAIDLVQQPLGLGRNRGLIGAEHDGIKIALHGGAAQLIPGRFQRRAPVKSQHIDVQLIDRRQQMIVAGAKVNDWHRTGQRIH